jgi:glycosyltransferase involved in cell wall biosynthesis
MSDRLRHDVSGSEPQEQSRRRGACRILPLVGGSLKEAASEAVGDRVTVVVPTRDRPEQLRNCLDALSTQTLGGLDVIVVDDGSACARRVEETVGLVGNARLIRTKHGGPAAARNAGIAAAGGAFVCFTDDDCEPDREWVARLVDALRSGADVVAGIVENGRPDDALAGAWHAIVDFLGEYGAFAPSNNVACRIEIIRAIPFDEAYGAAAGEDRDWCERVAAAGYRIEKEPRARVVHHQRLSPSGFLRQHYRYGEAAYMFRRRSGGVGPARFYAGLVSLGFSRGIRTGVFVALAQVATAAGYFVAWARANSRSGPR